MKLDAKRQFSLRYLLGCLLVVSLVFAFARWFPALFAAIAIATPLYVLLISVAYWLRSPMLCAIAWPAIRILCIVPFAVIGALVAGQRGLQIFAFGLLFDAFPAELYQQVIAQPLARAQNLFI